MRFTTIVGARPQFIKAAPLSAVLRRDHEEFLLHTGQHYDDNMSDLFFRELGIPEPDRHLGVGSGPHGAQTAAMLERIEQVLVEVQPDAVIVFGDTNSTLSGALTAAKLGIPVAHVEAGLRSFNRQMPEEINRVLTDHVSQWLFAPSQTAAAQLAAEGIMEGVHNVGDVMADCCRRFRDLARRRSEILTRSELEPKEYCVATVHRAANTDDHQRLAGILHGLRSVPFPVVFPMHPRTKAAIDRYGLRELVHGAPSRRSRLPASGALTGIEPVGYLDMLQLQREAVAVFTDSGGMQKEAYYLGVPCVTLREETEWVETVDAGWNVLVGSDPEQISSAVRQSERRTRNGRPTLYGDGHAAERVLSVLTDA